MTISTSMTSTMYWLPFSSQTSMAPPSSGISCFHSSHSTAVQGCSTEITLRDFICKTARAMSLLLLYRLGSRFGWRYWNDWYRDRLPRCELRFDRGKFFRRCFLRGGPLGGIARLASDSLTCRSLGRDLLCRGDHFLTDLTGLCDLIEVPIEVLG